MNNKKNPFAAIGQAARSARETEPELSPEPLPQVQPESSSSETQHQVQPELLPEPQPQVQPEPQKPKGRQGKRSDPNYRQTTVYINKDKEKKLKAAFLEDGIEDFSEWLEDQINQWLKHCEERSQ